MLRSAALLFSLITIVGLSNATVAQETKTVDPSGTWRWTSELGGNQIDGHLKLRANGKRVSGHYDDQNVDVEIADGRIDGDRLKCGFEAEAGGVEFEAIFEGKVAQDSIEGTITLAGDGRSYDFPWTARRATESDDVVGDWDFAITAFGREVESQASISLKGEKLAASYTNSLGNDMEVSSVTLKDNTLNFTAQGEYQGNDIELLFSGVPRGNSMSGTITVAAQGQEFEGTFDALRRVPAKPSNYPPNMPEAIVRTYKKVGDVELSAWIFNPQGHTTSDRRPAAVFFFGGGWRSGTPGQFHHHCRYLAARGMVAITADYRVATRHGVKAKECVEDAKSAIRWVRKHASDLGVDPNRIVASGGSAGGHLAATTGTINGRDASNENLSVSSVPNAMALFNPAVVLADVNGQPPMDAERTADLTERMGVAPIELSPYHHVQAGLPPTIIFHGRADTTIPFESVAIFTAAMNKAGNRCELKGYDDAAHGFFNHGREENGPFRDTVGKLDAFLVSLNYLEATPSSAALEILK